MEGWDKSVRVDLMFAHSNVTVTKVYRWKLALLMWGD